MSTKNKVSDKEDFTVGEHLKNFFEISNELLCIVGEQGFVYLSSSWESTLGYTRDELMKISYINLVHPDDIAITEKTVEEIKKGKDARFFVNRYRKKDGEYVWLSWHAKYYSKNGLRYASARDITDLKRAEDELELYHKNLRDLIEEKTKKLKEEIRLNEEANEKIKTLLEEQSIIIENSTDFLYRHDKNGVFYYMSSSVEKLTGYKVDDWCAHYSKYMTDCDSNKKVINYTEDTLKNGTKYPPYPVEILCKDGTKKILEVNEQPYMDESGDVVGIVGIARDITERQYIKSELEEQQRIIATLVNNLPGMVYRCKNNKDWTMEFLSDGCLDLTGYEPGEFQNSKLHYADIILKEYRRYVWEEVQKALKKKEPFKVLYQIKTKQGIIKWVWEQGIGVFSKDDKLLFLEGYITDITEKIEAQEALKKTIEELTKSNTSLERFAHIASHDLQEPLRSIYSYTQLLGEEYGDKIGEDGRRYIERAKESAARMKELIEDLLIYSSLNSKVQPFGEVDCKDIFESSINNLSAMVREIGAEITRDDLPVIYADNTQIMQLFQNIIGNALKYHDPRKKTKIHVTARRDGEGFCLISVSDNGIGIEKQYLQKIFDIFFHLHSTKDYAGTGVGLAICKRVVENHNGRIWAESTLGKGTTFHLRLQCTKK